MRALILVGLAITAGCAPVMRCYIAKDGVTEICAAPAQCRDTKTGQFVRCK